MQSEHGFSSTIARCRSPTSNPKAATLYGMCLNPGRKNKMTISVLLCRVHLLILNFSFPANPMEDIVKPLKILRAAAGSGKTFSLTVQFLILLFSGKNKYRQILAVTFTNKATAEMKHRILSVLEALAKGDWDPVRGYLDALNKAYPQWSQQQLQQQAAIIFSQILHDYSRFSVSTIDKFVQQVIRGFTFELGIDAGYRIEMNLGKVARELSEKLHESLEAKPELLQWIIDYAKRQINKEEPWSYQRTLLGLSKSIFSEDYQRFDEAIRADEEDAFFKDMEMQLSATITSFESKIKTLYEQAQKIFLASGVEADMLNGKSRNFLLKLAADLPVENIPKFEKYVNAPEAWENKKDPHIAVTALYQQLNPALINLLDFYRKAAPEYTLANALEENIYYLRLMKEMSRLLSAYRSENRLLLISDAAHLISGITRDIGDNPSFIWEKSGNRYTHFLFDEFQDTSKQQWQNFLPLVQNALGSARGKMTEHLVVGDVKQSIYRWRNGDWRLLLEGARENLGPNFVAEEALKENYRSAENIIYFNNLLFESGPRWLQQVINGKVEEKEGTDYFESAWKGKRYDDIILRAYQDAQQQIPEKTLGSGGIIDWEVIPVENNKHRPSQIKQAVLKETADTLYRWIVEEKRYQAAQIGILVRRAQDAIDIIDFLVRDQEHRAVKNAFQIISGSALKLENNDAIQLLINTFYLLLYANKNNEIYKANCIQLYRQVASRENRASAPLASDDWLRIAQLPLSQLFHYLPEKICRSAHALLHLPLAELTEYLISAYELDVALPDLPYLFAFRDYIAEFCNNGDLGISAFLEWWEDQDDRSLPASETGNVVQVLTIHKAKGLAYDVVMLPFPTWDLDGMTNAVFWADMQGTAFERMPAAPLKYNKTLAATALKDAYYEEMLFSYMDALNTLYVALTRARTHLWIRIPGLGGKPLENYLASDIIRVALEDSELRGRKFIFPEKVMPAGTQQETAPAKETWSFDTYPRASHLNMQLNKETSNQLERMDRSGNIRFGLILHELLSRSTELQRIPEILTGLQLEGWFSEGERKKLEEMARKVLTHQDLSLLLQKPYETLSERDILDPTGASHRPDKVLCGPTETLIIDFKFTSEESKAHFEQMETYKNLLYQMGYPGIKAYLFYGFLNHLVEA
jgi:ATP-dependent exoDNAse (exonuclease V) beta subunit